MEYPNIVRPTTHDELWGMKEYEQLLYRAYWLCQIENGAEVEAFGTDGWTDASLYTGFTPNPISLFRFKQLPKMVELDITDQLVGTIAVKPKNLCDESRHLITDQYNNGVNFNEDWCSYSELRELYTRLDGTKFEKEAL